MSRPRTIYENVTVSSVAAEGKALCRVNDIVVFVPWVVPGDVVDIEITKRKHSYCEAKVVRVVTASPLRISPQCEHFGICGGCKWQNLRYAEQLQAKSQQVYDQLSRIGKVELPPFLPILGSEREYEYRNKLEFAFSNRRWLTEAEIAASAPITQRDALGFHITGAWDKIYPIHHCHLMPPMNDAIRNAIYDYAIAHQLPFYDVRNNVGLLRGIVLRCNSSGEWMLIIQFRIDSAADQGYAEALMTHIAELFPQITALLYVDNHKCNDTFTDLPVHAFSGKDHLMETMDGLSFKIGPKSFYQTNTRQAFRLYSVVRSLAQLTGSELVYDLYTGTGTIALFVSRGCHHVIGIEYVPEAIADAKVNAEINGITNAEFFAGDMKDILTGEFLAQHGTPDVIITDPPRAGMHADVVATILSAKPQRIVYVSCNPATQARDLQLLDTAYKVVAVQPVDMFPHTPHIENVVLLSRR